MYFRLPAKTKISRWAPRHFEEHLRRWMGNELFERLRTTIRAAKLTKQGFEGEPDLFSWNPTNGQWFFAEAKGEDKLTDTQPGGFAVCRTTLPGVTIKVCRVRPLMVNRPMRHEYHSRATWNNGTYSLTCGWNGPPKSATAQLQTVRSLSKRLRYNPKRRMRKVNRGATEHCNFGNQKARAA